jgi:hypothetical protein
LLQEWGTWKNNGLPVFRREHPTIGVVDMMLEVLSDEKYHAYLTIRELFAIALSLVLSTSIAESGYSVLNAVKNEHTNALADDTLDDILNIRFNGPLEMPVCVVMFLSN